MAMMDNAEFLISHIRNSYITSDDTGMCEMIIESEEAEKQQGDKRPTSWHANSGQLDSSFSDSGFEHSDNELSHSYDIFPDMDYGAHRRRSNTAQRLERMKKEKRSQVKVKHICWKEIPPEFKECEKGHLFEKVDLPSPSDVEDTEEIPKKSLLTDQLENFSSTSDNPFMEYAKYDGRSNLGAGVKKIEIFLTMAPPRDRPYPMTVVVLSTAKVQDLVGLICWQYTSEGREPKLFENVECYCLHIAEDDGEVDTDFPSLDNREPASKFGFGKLALVEKSPPPRSLNTASIVVTITIPNRGFSKIPVENLNIPLKDLMEKVLKKRKIKLRPGMSYNFEKLSDHGVSLDLDSLLSSINTLELCLVRQHSSRGDSEVVASNDTSTVALSSHQYKSFMVEMVNKFRTNSEVLLGISGEKVEIDPVARKGAGRIFRQKPITYDAEMVAACEKLEEKSTGKCVFRMTYYTGHEYKHQDFEALTETADEIVEKFNNILELRLSPVRKDFLATKKRHLKKRESFR